VDGRGVVDIPTINSRDEFVRRTLVASMLASTGRRDEVHRLVTSYELIDGPAGQLREARDAVLDAVAHALCAIVDHDDERAHRHLADVVEQHHASPILEQHLRRFYSIFYVLDPGVRARWDIAPLGPTHHKARATSRLLLDLRAGRRPVTCDLDPAQVLTTFPLPWSIELACRLHANKHPSGAQLGAWLIDQVPEPAQDELRYLADGENLVESNLVARAAGDLLSRLPAVPSQCVEISVLGPLTVTFDGVATSSSEIRRARVRTLLALLVVHENLSRDRAIDLLWPELGGRDGARNLRVTLTYLRQLLEPDRPTGEASFHLRADGATISLHRSELVVDLWELRRLVTDAATCRGAGDSDRSMSLLSAATAYWRGEPLNDLDAVAGEEHEVEHVRLLQLSALLDLGELRLARGYTAHASHDAERSLALDPYSERAHRLAMAAALHSHDQPRTDVVADRVLAMLDELGADPEPATKILLRQAG
jgi:DNA-binding SARP family transcriptional activator